MIIDIIERRRSVFPAQYNDRAVSRETIQKLLRAANCAPSHKHTEPWRFKVLMGASKKRLGEFLSAKYQEIETNPKQIKIKKLLENPQKAGAVIAICMQRDPNKSLPEWEELAATAMAVQNMWLVATELNLGSYWSSPGLITYMDDFFNLNEGEKCLGFFYVGYYDGPTNEVTKKPLKDKVEWFD